MVELVDLGLARDLARRSRKHLAQEEDSASSHVSLESVRHAVTQLCDARFDLGARVCRCVSVPLSGDRGADHWLPSRCLREVVLDRAPHFGLGSRVSLHRAHIPTDDVLIHDRFAYRMTTALLALRVFTIFDRSRTAGVA